MEAPLFITDEAELRSFVARAREAEAVGIDTEFIREKTYYARLCLIQIATEQVQAIVDPLVLSDLAPLCDLLHDPAVTKVFHAAEQDLEILYRRTCPERVWPLFDTQVAATVSGFPHQVGYAVLVRELLGIVLDKGDAFTDWCRRPLSATQISYAQNDVRYLPLLYRALRDEMERTGRLEWLSADMERVADPARYRVVPEEQWRRLKRISSLNRRQLAIAREVAAWREREAMRRDVPRRWVLSDESVVEIARRAPGTVEELMAVRGVADKVGRSAAHRILEAIQRGAEAPEEELPSLARRRRPAADLDAAVDLMAALVRARAKEHGVAVAQLASREELERLAAGEREDHPLLAGWRAAIVGRELVDLLEGRLRLRLSSGELVVEPAEAP